MARIHLFEFEDLPWFPSFLRNYGTDFLQFLANKTKMYEPVIPLLQKGLQNSCTAQIVDLASGGSGGLLWLNQELKKTYPLLKILLTDYFPNTDAFDYTKKQAENIDYLAEPVDARDVPEKLKGLRTQFLSLHHFTPSDAQRILQNAVDAQQPIAIFEAQERSFRSILAMFFSPITVLLTTPMIRPFKLGRILYTYLIPIVPLFVWWDGMVSCLRTYSVKEMQHLVNQLNKKDSFAWDIGKMKSGPGVILYLLGTKK
ncbi:hypothetical protein OKW21_003424 [Catalinimonas alkaloidigena]|uniref:hypothetical protein n=1 Tax=Catalinimonas alkaloidigena TaxID=1075417 RepID=UPI0024066C82|nr:hypothetical protein [Catalinimonas alkaloidigena]MDF9798161.1 hypothetical protein [Catalinimonas alkaloidigena]